MSKTNSIQGKVTYIDVDSTFRDRMKYPNPADFKVEYSNRRNRHGIDKAQNILSDSYPYYQWQWGCKGTGSDGTGQSTVVSTITGGSLVGTPLELSLSDALTAPTDGSVDSIASNFASSTTNIDYFSGLKISIDAHGATDKTQQSRIIKHNSIENTITLSSALSGGGASDFILETSDWIITNSSSSSKIFIPGGSSKNGNYVGDYYECLMYGSSAAANPTVHQFRKITKYDGYTKLATLESALSFFDSPDGAANQSGTHSTTYLHRLRKGLPILPSGSSSAIGTDNIPVVKGTANSGAIARISLHTAGSGHVVGNVVTIAGGTNGKVLVDAVDGNGGVLVVSLLRAGSGYSTATGSLQSATSGAGIGLKINILQIGTGINIHNSNGVSTIKNTYKDKILYYPAFLSGGGTANTDPSAAQDFIPHDNSLNVDSPSTAYTDSKHCSFHILAHNFYVTDGINEVVIKSLSTTEVAFFVANKEYNILDYKEDGVKSIVNNTNLDPRHLANYYEISLLNLTLPNSALMTGPGGFLGNHSYIMVEFYSESHDKTQIYNTNNPNLENVMFKCMVLDTSNPNTIPFLKFRGYYPVLSPFRLDESVNFRVLMPNGEVFRTTSGDSVPPITPKKELQVSATFMLKRID
jgi:hypothetical protein